MNTILITGGAGFIGSRLAKKLVQCGDTVIVYDNFSNGKLLNLEDIKNKIKVVRADILNREVLQRCIKVHSPNIVFHLAAMHYIPDCVKNPSKTYRVNVQGTKNILESLSRSKCNPYFVFISSAAVYKDSNRAVTEKDPLEPIDIYGVTKLLGEGLVDKYCFQYDIPYSTIRLFNTYGPNDSTPHIIPRVIEQLGKGNNVIRIGDMVPKRDFIYIDDVIDFLTRLIAVKNEGAIYNLGTGKAYSVKYLTECFKRILKDKKEISFLSYKKFFRETDRLCLMANIRKIKSDIGWQPVVNIQRGLEITLREEGLL